MNKKPIYDIVDIDKKHIVEGDYAALVHAKYKLKIIKLSGDNRNLKIVVRDGEYDYLRKP